MDNLYADYAAVPMIVVMPYGYSESQPSDMKDGPREWTRHVYPRLDRDIIEEVVPLVDAEYSTASGPENKAIAGLSMGGGHAFYIGLNHLDTFSWIGSFSSGINDMHRTLLENPTNINKKCKLLWLACGKDDVLF